jgi:hypothetical protein
MRPQPTITALQRAADRVVFFNVLSGRANYMSLAHARLSLAPGEGFLWRCWLFALLLEDVEVGTL